MYAPTSPIVLVQEEEAGKTEKQASLKTSTTKDWVELVTKEQLEKKKLDWYGLSFNTELTWFLEDRPYPADIVGRYLIIRDEFDRFYPVGMAVTLHPNRFIIGAIFFNSLAPNPDTGIVQIGTDAFPSRYRGDYETFEATRVSPDGTANTTLAFGDQSNTANLKDSSIEKGGGGGVYRIHYLCQSWFQRHLFPNSAGADTYQIQKFAAARDVKSPVKEARVEFFTEAECRARTRSKPEFRKMPAVISAMMSSTPRLLPDRAPSGRQLDHSFSLPYRTLSEQQMQLASTLWKNFAYPTLEYPHNATRPIIRRSQAVASFLARTLSKSPY